MEKISTILLGGLPNEERRGGDELSYLSRGSGGSFPPPFYFRGKLEIPKSEKS